MLQLLMDRLLRKLLDIRSKMKTRSEIAEDVRPLTSQETNAVCYMDGYVAITLMKRYTEHPNQTSILCVSP